MTFPRKPLPKIAVEFLETKKGVWSDLTLDRFPTALGHFHSWLKDENLRLRKLHIGDLRRFVAHSQKRDWRRQTIQVFLSNVCVYLEWLREKRIVRVNLENAFPESNVCNRSRPLPRPAQQFLAIAAVNLSPASLRDYQITIRTFHTFLNLHRYSIKNLKRRHIEQLIQEMWDTRITPASRVQRLILVRVYLRWLHAQEMLITAPERLIYPTDFPKIPEYLPRPLSPETDRKLQKAFLKSDRIEHWGLLLMRCTGMRIGELVGLTFDCIRNDYKGNAFLKIELGKLKNERLVPLEKDSVDLIERIQKRSREHLSKLVNESQPIGLLYGKRGLRLSISDVQDALKEIVTEIGIEEHITSHLLRHTFATTLLNAGISLFSLMKLLGHRHIRMTLRYAAVTDASVRREYFNAITKITEDLPEVRASSSNLVQSEPLKTLPNLVKWIQSHEGFGNQNQKHLLCKRIQKIDWDLKSKLKKSRES